MTNEEMVTTLNDKSMLERENKTLKERIVSFHEQNKTLADEIAQMKLEILGRQLAEKKDYCITGGLFDIGKLYDHRNHLYIAFCRALRGLGKHFIWRSRVQSNGHTEQGWFLLGVNTGPGEQITYHLPEKHWVDVEFAETLDVAPQFDGHTSEDVLHRLATIPWEEYPSAQLFSCEEEENVHHD